MGLEDVVVSTSSICTIDGHKGTLSYRGYDIADLGKNVSFEEVAYLLWYGELPTSGQLAELQQRLRAECAIPAEVFAMMKLFPRDAEPMSVLRSTVSALALYDPTANDRSHDAGIEHAIRLTARMGGLVSNWARISQGLEPVQAANDLTIAGNFLYMLRGSRPDADETHALDVALTMQAEHEFNASTFAARVTVATLSDMYSGTTSAIGALKGPLHGGANEQVMRMLQAIGDPSHAEQYVKDAIGRHERLMGFGHRVYKVEDPRATVLRPLAKQLGDRTGRPDPYEISREIEKAVLKERGLYPNVDFYTASVYHTLNIATELFTPVFAVSRITGWTAHMLEQYEHNRLIRPRAEYTGSAPRTVTPIDKR